MLVVFATFSAFSLAASAAIAPEIDDALATYSVTSPAPTSAPVPCTGLDSKAYATTRGTATGTSTDNNPGGRFSLSGNVKITSTNTIQISFSGLSHGVATGAFQLTYPEDKAHRLVGTFQGVVRVNAATNASYGRGFILAKYQKKVATSWVPTGDILFANTTFSGVQNLDGSSTISGSIGSATDFAGTGGALNDLAEKAISACP